MSATYQLSQHLNPEQAVHLCAAAQQNDQIAPLSEQYLRGISDSTLGHKHICVYHPDPDADEMIALLAIAQQSAELVVAPAFRRQGIATTLIEYGQEHGVKKWWAHGNFPAATHLAQRFGLAKTRELFVMGTNTGGMSVEKHIPAGFVQLDLSALRQRYADADQQWLRVNNEAFSWHPEQGGWDGQRLARAQDTEWFNPHDVLFLVEESTGGIAGFHWVKQHDERVGEIYVVGLADAYRGRGLGQPLIVMGVKQLMAHGVQEIILYVESDNVPAIRAYESLGFQVQQRHGLYSAAE
ncbi:mycothiol synthase [Corynebacterium sp. sy039]|uniref:mycothiol synthase n=1 Tax=Corynebacterium sp. sy039 TaxID=2599641 RepID=UPI0011B4B764|nr:mycothiol synthase [Corynebacterium sp. sy039]QDZ43149.1 mycothiol synthase [Corynebacterium sp. sy039]